MKANFLVRFFKEEQHAIDFLNKGEIYMNSLKYFKKYEEAAKNNVRDPDEGISHINQIENISGIKISSDAFNFTIKPEDLAGPLVFRNTSDDHCKIYCLSILEFDIGGMTDGAKIKIQAKDAFDFDQVNLGDTCVVICDGREFINRIEKTKQYRALATRAVNYYDFNSHNGDIKDPVFNKRREYSKQREFRVMIRADETEDPHTISIGCIKDIAGMMSKNDLIDHFFYFSATHAK